MTVFELLRQIVEGTEADPAGRIAELERRRPSIEREIRQMRAGDRPVLDGTQVKDRFLQMDSTARGLLGDFRQVEQNFRDLDRAVRERVACLRAARARCWRRSSASATPSRIPTRARASARSGTS